MSSNDIVFADFSRRTVLPAAMAVKGVPRFRYRDWERSLIAREASDLPPLMRQKPFEEIILAGTTAEITVGTEAGLVGRRSLQFYVDEPELSIAPEPFAVVADDSIRGAAAEALRRISTVKRPRVAPRPIARPAPSQGRPLLVWILAAVIVASAAVTLWQASRGLS